MASLAIRFLRERCFLKISFTITYHTNQPTLGVSQRFVWWIFACMTLSYQFCIHIYIFYHYYHHFYHYFFKNISLSLSLYKIYIYIFMTLRHHPLLLNRPLFLSASACQVLGVNEVKTLDATALSEEIQKATTLELRLWPGEEMTGGKRTKQRNVWGTQKTWRTKGFLIRAFIKGKQWLGKNI